MYTMPRDGISAHHSHLFSSGLGGLVGRESRGDAGVSAAQLCMRRRIGVVGLIGCTNMSLRWRCATGRGFGASCIRFDVSLCGLGGCGEVVEGGRK